ncbi:hypothetical protein Val02_31760 [Virgisporangium aliadipatigenens]|uniref:MmpS family membrane protein n=1 Tax=Virgisporangium aliadipatigenens TaxID=741659 RepID=A0A8J3YLW7_9ACTN|nr:hypothetical protein [Virgisporangium aliadipatigenens]GIJ46290.1 hypothetical protein Val02_31760 [Virgisporangium aliadipatigenens]
MNLDATPRRRVPVDIIVAVVAVLALLTGVAVVTRHLDSGGTESAAALASGYPSPAASPSGSPAPTAPSTPAARAAAAASAASLRRAPASPARHQETTPAGGTITYEVTGAGHVSLRWIGPDGQAGEDPDVALPWRKTFTDRGNGMSLSARRLSTDEDGINCRILDRGRVASMSKAAGPHARVGCML